jgi:hypothetical protein
MNRYLRLSISSLLIATCTYAQTPDDALRSAWFIPGGSARNIATGGVMGSLGGDITANNVNPAGIGLYKTREFVISPGFLFNSNKAVYRDSSSSKSKNAFAYGPIGFVFGRPHGRDSKWTSSAFSVSVSQLASYNNHVSYSGFNNMSSFSEQYIEELVRDNASEDAANGNYINGASLAYRTYLIDTFHNAGGDFIGYQSLVPISTGVYQQYSADTKGGYHEIALAFAGNMADKLYLGGGVNIPVISYTRDVYYKETDATNNPSNNFSYFEYTEHFKSSGIGLNGKLGLIYKPKEFIRLGVAVHTPSIISFKDELRSTITTNTEAFAGLKTESSDNLNSGNPVTRDYYQLTPWRAIISGSYVFREVENTHNQRAFLSADIEYVNYRGSRYYTNNSDDQGAKDYYKQANEAIKSYLKSAFNFRLGGELKFDPWMFRLGLAYYGSPYKDKELKANRIMTSGGIGYRNHGMFIDLTYAYTMNKDVNFPYRLNDVPNTFATTKNNRGNLLLTVGFKI